MSGGNVRNNPLNIKNNPENPWRGSIGTDNRGHAIFADAAWGIRAAMVSLAKKWSNGKKSLIRIINDWAPADDTIGSIAGAEPNDPSDYAHFVARRCGLKIGDTLPNPRQNPKAWIPVISAMAHFENGVDCDPAIIERGISLWLQGLQS